MHYYTPAKTLHCKLVSNKKSLTQFDGATHSEVYGVAMLQIHMYVPYMFAQKYKRSLGCNKFFLFSTLVEICAAKRTLSISNLPIERKKFNSKTYVRQVLLQLYYL